MFLLFRILTDISFARFGFCQKLVLYSHTTHILSFYLGMLTSPLKSVWRIVFHFFNKIQDCQRITCFSQELELLHQFVPSNQQTNIPCLPWP